MDVKKVMVKAFNSGNLRGFATVNVGDDTDVLTINDLKIMEKKVGGEFFVSFPSVKITNKEGNVEYKDVCFPVTASLRSKIQDAVLKQYMKKVGSTTSKPSSVVDDNDLPF